MGLQLEAADHWNNWELSRILRQEFQGATRSQGTTILASGVKSIMRGPWMFDGRAAIWKFP